MRISTARTAARGAAHAPTKGMKTSPIPLSKWRSRGGFSSAEALISLCIGAVAVAGGLTMNSHELKLVKATREAGSASGVLEERVEQLRTANWRQLTSPRYLADSYFATLPKSAASLSRYTERITISAWPDEDAVEPIVIEKKPKAVAGVVQPGGDLADQRLAKVDVHITWLGKDRRVRTRELSTMISNGGISRVNLPALGTAGPAGDTATPTPTPTATSTPAPTATPDPDATPAPTPDPTPTSSGNGNGNDNDNGNGRGNVSGKSGKA